MRMTFDQQQNLRSLLRVWSFILGALFCTLVCSLSSSDAAEIKPEFLMYRDPAFVIPPPILRYTPGLQKLWIETLQRPEADFQRLAAETIAFAHRKQIPDLEPARPRLLEILSAEGTHPTARQAAARALIELDTRDAASQLFAAGMKFGPDLRQIVEPALANWKFEPIREEWRKRLTASEVLRRDLILAIRGSGLVGDAGALPALLKIVHSSQKSADLRLASARSAGQIQPTGLEPDARNLATAKNATVIQRLCAAALLTKHDSPAARELLLQSAVDSEPTVAIVALRRLLEIDPSLVLPLVEQLLQNADPHVRQAAAETYVARPTAERMISLVKRLDDVHPAVRSYARDVLFDLAQQTELSETIRREALLVLGQESWRGQEQAGLLLGALDHKPAAPRLVELLTTPRPEVQVSTAWALRKLAVLESLPVVLAHAQKIHMVRGSGPLETPELDAHMSHLFELLGQQKYLPADSLLRLYIPKSLSYGNYSRPAAIWALGRIHEGNYDEQLANQLADRVADASIMPPEMDDVRVLGAVTIARIKGVPQIPKIRGWMGPKLELMRAELAIAWAIHELTGEEFENPPPHVMGRSGFFLEPLTSQNPTVPSQE